MTVAVNAEETGKKIAEAIPGSVVSSDKGWLDCRQQSAGTGGRIFLKDTPGMDFDYLTVVTAVDYLDYFEVVYRLVSMKNNQSLILKTRLLYP